MRCLYFLLLGFCQAVGSVIEGSGFSVSCGPGYVRLILILMGIRLLGRMGTRFLTLLGLLVFAFS